MKTPLKSPKKQTNALSVVKELIPRGSIVESPSFYDGAFEFSLCEDQRFVLASTNRYVVYEFWKCVLDNPNRVVELSEYLFPVIGPETFEIMQENWAHYKDPYVRSAMFFLLNRCSDGGKVSSGVLNKANYNHFAISALKNFRATNFHISYKEAAETQELIGTQDNSTHILFHGGRFSYNLFQHGKVKSLEEQDYNHRQILLKFRETDKKVVAIYDKHPALKKLLKGFEVIYIDESGNKTTENKAKEMVFHNV